MATVTAATPLQPPPFRRSSTVPTRLIQRASEAQPDDATPDDNREETLFTHQAAKIVSFNAPSLRVQNQDAGTLAWTSRSERVISVGPLRLYRLRGSVSFLKSGPLSLSLLPRSQCWCVDGESKFAMRIQLLVYRIELPFSTDEEKRQVEDLKEALKQVLQYERTPCPFKRGFTVDVPEEVEGSQRRRFIEPYRNAKRWELTDAWRRESRVNIFSASSGTSSPDISDEDGTSQVVVRDNAPQKEHSGNPSPNAVESPTVENEVELSLRPQAIERNRSVTAPAHISILGDVRVPLRTVAGSSTEEKVNTDALSGPLYNPSIMEKLNPGNESDAATIILPPDQEQESTTAEHVTFQASSLMVLDENEEKPRESSIHPEGMLLTEMVDWIEPRLQSSSVIPSTMGVGQPTDLDSLEDKDDSLEDETQIGSTPQADLSDIELNPLTTREEATAPITPPEQIELHTPPATELEDKSTQEDSASTPSLQSLPNLTPPKTTHDIFDSISTMGTTTTNSPVTPPTSSPTPTPSPPMTAIKPQPAEDPTREPRPTTPPPNSLPDTPIDPPTPTTPTPKSTRQPTTIPTTPQNRRQNNMTSPSTPTPTSSYLVTRTFSLLLGPPSGLVTAFKHLASRVFFTTSPSPSKRNPSHLQPNASPPPTQQKKKLPGHYPETDSENEDAWCSSGSIGGGGFADEEDADSDNDSGAETGRDRDVLRGEEEDDFGVPLVSPVRKIKERWGGWGAAGGAGGSARRRGLDEDLD